MEKKTKVCSGCKAELPIGDFGACTARAHLDGKQNDCWVCIALDGRKREAKKLGLPFELTAEWFRARLPHGCPCCHRPFVRGTRGSCCSQSPSMDRFKPAKGYTMDNSWLICLRCNASKGDHTPAEAMRLALFMAKVDVFERRLSMSDWVKLTEELEARVETTVKEVMAKYGRS